MRTLVVSLLFSVSTSVFAQDSATDLSSVQHPYRDPHRARALATILPGAGYAYTGEYLRGYATWVVTATGLMVGPMLIGESCGLVSWTCGRQERLANTLSGSLLILTSASAWISSIRDAPRSAERANERELIFHPRIGITSGAERPLNAGFGVDW
jgi:hypothetical protein